MSEKRLVYNDAIADEICSQLASGKSLLTICKQDGFPDKSTVFHWLFKYKDFNDKYAQAREAWADAIFEEILEISDNDQQDTTTNERGTEVANHEWIARSRLRVDTRKWALARMSPRKYGEHNTTDLNVTEKQGAISEEQKANRIKAIVERAQARGKKIDISDLV